MEPEQSTWGPNFSSPHARVHLFSPQLNSGYYVSGSSSGFQGGQITLSMQKVSSSILPGPSCNFFSTLPLNFPLRIKDNWGLGGLCLSLTVSFVLLFHICVQ